MKLLLLLLESQLEVVGVGVGVEAVGQGWQHQISQLLSGHEGAVDEAHGIGVDGRSGHKSSPESFNDSELLSESFPSLSSIGYEDKSSSSMLAIMVGGVMDGGM